MRSCLLILFCIATISVFSQTVGLFQHSQGSLDSGYVLFAPVNYTTTYLIDKCGKLVHSWPNTNRPGQSVYLLPDGNILRPANDATNTTYLGGGRGGIIDKIDWDGNIVWSYKISDVTQCQHHDVKALPNGNILVLAWEKKTKAEAIAAGRNPNLVNLVLWTEKVLELQPIGTDSAVVVWEWHVWDHLVQEFDNTKPNYGIVSAYPDRINLNYTKNGTIAKDWIHMNSVDYNPEFDQIILSSHVFEEIWIIDHSTTTAQAAGHTGGNYSKGGDLLYRWGNPQTYNQGTVADQKLFGQHNARWIPKGFNYQDKIMIFNNGSGRPGGNFSSVEIISPPIDNTGTYNTVTMPFLPVSSDWTYADPVPTSFYALNISGAQMLSNGNVLVCDGPNANFFELDSAKNKVWNYVSPISSTGPVTQGTTSNISVVFRCTFYPASYSGFAGRTLVAGEPIELNPLPYSCTLDSMQVSEQIISSQQKNIIIYPNPVTNILTISNTNFDYCEIIDCNGKIVFNNTNLKNLNIDMGNISQGVYFLKISRKNKISYHKIVKI